MARAGKKAFNRADDDVGNILAMEHVNVTVPDQSLATYFYVNGLGFTRDPYIDFGPFNVWINVGNQQFHMPTNDPQVLRGHVGVVVPDLDQLEARLSRVATRLKDTAFAYRRQGSTIRVTCPWGNQIHCHGPGGFGEMTLGIPYIEFTVPRGTAAGIARFYQRVFDCSTVVKKTRCEVDVGRGQSLRFRETGRVGAYDGHHIAIYVVNFSRPHDFLKDHGLITEESDAHQYRFQTIIDPDSGEALFDVEHEVRSLHHPMYERHLVNRNAEQSFFNYHHGRDAFVP
jgi:catechol 2,3-dioxygenase-like lactoylglutathione lyase family enzyme